MKTKLCLKCNKIKNINEFYKDKTRKDGHYSYCKVCSKKRLQKIYKDNKNKKIEYQKEYYQKHKEEKRKYDKNYKQKNKVKRNCKENELYSNDRIYRLKKQLRSCIYKSFKKRGYVKKLKTQEIIGCDYNTFISYLLQTFKSNYGYEWNKDIKVHIDHIIPLATANTEEEIIRLCHYTNLQLLKEKDNLFKSSKINYKINRSD